MFILFLFQPSAVNVHKFKNDKQIDSSQVNEQAIKIFLQKCENSLEGFRAVTQ